MTGKKKPNFRKSGILEELVKLIFILNRASTMKVTATEKYGEKKNLTICPFQKLIKIQRIISALTDDPG